MNVLVIGGGGREHALTWKIKHSPLVNQIFCAPGNAGTDGLATNVNIAADDIEALLIFAQEKDIGLTVVGPEQPLVMGIVDRFQEKGLIAFGPSAAAAEIEGSKVFCKQLMETYNIPTARAYTRSKKDFGPEITLPGLTKFIEEFNDNQDKPLVVKASGLAAGKGVTICENNEASAKACWEILVDNRFGDSGNEVVVEDFLTGQEISFLAFSDGDAVVPMVAAQDHKAIYDGDRGPNTGGMGAYSPPPVFTPELEREVMETIMIPTVNAMRAEGRPYRGLLYAGLMLTEQGPKVLEFNARFGDPETQALMMRMDFDLVPVMLACTRSGELAAMELAWKTQPAVCVVMAAGGYPASYAKGKTISGLDRAGAMEDVTVFHAGTKLSDGAVVTSGGRVLGVTALGDDIRAAIDNAYGAVKSIEWEDAYFRTDIGHRALG